MQHKRCSSVCSSKASSVSLRPWLLAQCQHGCAAGQQQLRQPLLQGHLCPFAVIYWVSGARIWRLNRVASVGLPCLDKTDFASCVRLKALPRNVSWLCWLEQA
jgi:hypothetical protein